MSVLIKGLTIPTVGVRHCVISFSDNRLLISDVCGNLIFEGNYVEIPTPHGRLIDADEIKEYAEWHCQRFIEGDHAEVGLTVDQINSFVRNAPTIIEAENSSAIDDDVKKYCDYLKSETYDFCNRIENGEVNEG